MSAPIVDHVFAALRTSGPDGLTANQIAEAVSRTRGRTTSRESVWKLLVERRGAPHRVPRLQVRVCDQIQRWSILEDVADPAPLPPPEADEPVAPTRILAWPASLTAALMGDPLPGRSAQDAREHSRAGGL